MPGRMRGQEIKRNIEQISQSWQAEIRAGSDNHEFQELAPTLDRLVKDLLLLTCAKSTGSKKTRREATAESLHQSLRNISVEIGAGWCELGISLEQSLRQLLWLRGAVFGVAISSEDQKPDTLIRSEEIHAIFDQITLAVVHGYLECSERRIRTALENERRPLDHLKSELIGVVSHELRTPLTAVLGYSDVLMRGLGGDLNQTQRHHLMQIRNAGQQLLTLITNLLEYSTIEAGLGQFSLTSVDMTALLNRLIGQIEPLAVEKTIAFDAEIPPDLPPVLADQNRTQQAIFQLLTNALKFTTGGGHVFVKAYYDSLESRVVISIHDTGVGIPPDQLALIWDIFQQADTSSTRRFGGLGLGLAVARKMIEGQNGRIWAASAGPGHGATFSISLPAAGVPNPAHHQAHSDVPPQA